MKTIGIVTGGGDAPGLNAVIRAAVKTAVGEFGMRVVGIEDSFEGLLGQTRTRVSPSRPSKLSSMPTTRIPYSPTAVFTAARITAFKPGASPPPVTIPMVFITEG